MHLGVYLALVATACYALDRNVGYLMSRDLNEAANGQLRCYVGIVTNYNNTSIGTEVFCDGSCGSISTQAGGYNFTTYNCFPTSFCDMANLTNTCSTIYVDRDLSGCCCNTDNCNVQGTNINTTIPVAPPEEPIACYSGISINNVTTAGSGWIACQGNCISVSILTQMNGNPLLGKIYSCDPTSVCTALGIENRCHSIEPGVVGACCCTTNACINPTVNPPKEPRGPLGCYVGLYSKAQNISAGMEVFCDGQCATLSSTVAGSDIAVFACVPQATCQALQLYNDCQTITADRDITGCCCDNINNCNAANYSLGTPRPRWEGDFPIACWSGIRVNQKWITPGGWTACSGDCASVRIDTMLSGAPYSAEIFTCDPASVCNQLGMVNNCTSVEPGVSGCCCSYDACLDPTRYPNKYPGDPLKCYAGFQTTYNGGMNVGSEVYCNGMCGALNTFVNGENVTTYMCTPRAVCRQLELYDEWKRLPIDREVKALCCDNFNYCNVRDPSINVSTPVRGRPEFPITCYNGIQVNGVWISNAGWLSCNGDCASININTTANGTRHSLSLYSCDPTAVCRGLNMTNTCGTLEPGVDGCCCNTNGCIDPSKSPAKTPANKLQCYVGLYAVKANINVGAEVYCNGKCASMRATVNGDDVTSFHCVPSSVCRSMELDDDCGRLPGDREVKACCCDNANSCNVGLINRTDVVNPTAVPSPNVEYPISCWNGVYVNGTPFSQVGFQNCNGQCASLTLNTTLNGNSHTASIYGCDPTSVCRALNMTNKCSVFEPGLGGCCCDSDACIYPPRNRDPGNPLLCFVGLYAPNANIKVGAEVYCPGQCSTFSGRLINGDQVTTFQCAPLSVCKSLELDNTCSALPGDRDIQACCCDTSNSCNAANYTNIQVPTPAPVPEYPISCWTGIYVNGNPVTSAGFRTCFGECASLTLQTNLGNATMYMCDPTAMCQSLGMSNQCATVESGLSGCCCNTDACLTPRRIPGNQLTCYVGMYAKKANINTGAEVPCNGKCSSLRTTVNGDDVTTFQCLPTSACKYLALNNGCGTLTGDRDITACCCDWENACNLKINNRTDIPVPTVSPVPDFPISCWSGVYVNGNAISNAGYQSCNGECAYISLTTNMTGVTYNAEIYTCDPTSVCGSMGMINNCLTLEPGVQGCCCNSDACLTPKRKPGNPLTCYVGMYAVKAGINTGGEVWCNGQCSSLRTTVNNDDVITFQCIPTTACKYLGLNNACGTLTGDRDVTACCCDSANGCNLAMNNRTDIPVPTPSPLPEFPISCWSGVYVNGNPITNIGFQTCYGECASIALTTGMGNATYKAEIYTCDPTSVCNSMGMSNNCLTFEPGVQGCCCNTDACLTPRRKPGNVLWCYVGLYAKKANVNVGGEVACDGQCSSLSGIVNGDMVTTFQCVPTSTCKSLALDNHCASLPGDRAVKGCCCDFGNSCNVNQTGITDINIPMPTPSTEFPISCWSGIYVNGNAITNAGFQSCYGECASVTLQTWVNSTQTNATIYTCDPTSMCKSLNMSNNCATVEPGLSGCCCNDDACLTPTRIPGNQLTCYVGMYAMKANINTGAEVLCNGKCSSLRTTVNGDDVTTFQCLPTSACKYFALNNGCGTLTADRDITACCCDSENACNLKINNRTDIPVPTVSPVPEFPISCWSGVYVNGTAISNAGYQSCNGECAYISLTTNMTGVTYNAEIYTCDPTSVCGSMGMINNCSTLETGLQGCCCNSDACLNPKRKPGNPLTCYVGMFAAKAGINTGGEVWCNGQCSSLRTTVNNDDVTTFQCIPTTACKYLGLNNACGTLTGDRDVTACCCDSANGCNLAMNNRTDIPVPTASPLPEFPISCWSGVYVNGNPITNIGFQTCYGECASIALTTNMTGVTYKAEIYTCDPTSVCNSMGMSNNCLTIEPGVQGCCCNTDACLTPRRKPGNVLWCYVGLYAKKANVNVGGEVACDGQCSSLSGIVNGDMVTTFQCVPTSTCKSLALDNHCASLPGDRAVKGCCCDFGNSCNVNQTGITDINIPIQANSTEFPISCWSGIYVNGNAITNAGFQSCYGECASVTLQTWVNGTQTNATIYTCDPTSMCKSLNMSNNCTIVETGLSGCCCNDDACLTPTRSPANNPLMCYVGVYAPNVGVNVGAQVPCVGMCSTLNGIVNGDNVTTFQCVPTSVCKTLSAYNGCNSLPGDRGVNGCCCDTPNCNLASRPDIIEPTPAPVSEYPISCWSGMYVDGTAISNAGYITCFGDCASVTLNTTLNNEQHTASLYMCDPTSVCRSLNMTNQCATVESGLGGCCCNTDGCLNPLTNTIPGNQLTCYVGMYAMKANINTGAEVPCNGKCSSLRTTVNGDDVTTFQCLPTSACKYFALNNGCGTLTADRDITACCCDSENACNLKINNRTDIPVPTVSPVPEFPISCWSGVYVNGTAISNAGYQSCNGECAYISLTTNMTGVTYNAEIYTCDPTSVCSSMGMINKCLILETGLQGCCCNSDACLNPERKPGNPLTCYVGMYAVKAGINTGGEVWCNGQCSSLRTTVNGDDVTTFQCIPTTACKYLGLNNACGTLTGDRDVTACCCDSANGCNLAMNNRTDIPIPTASPLPEFPISCWSGVYVNGNPITNIGFQTCYGECASIALTTGMGNATYKAEIYSCDPTSVCNSMGMSNNCLTIEPGVQGCCCNTDACLTPKRKPGNVLWCYVGLYAKKANVNVGGEVVCDGQCSSLSGLVNGDMVTTFQCVPKSVCKSLALDNHCASLPGDRAVKGCCCDFSNSCNVNLTGIPDINIPIQANSTEFPISCWSGIYVNGNAITNAGFQSCYGECASVTLQTWVNSTQTNATIYTCDPTSMCKSLNMSNNCATVEQGLSGCCCNDDACLTPTKSPANNPLMCYVGVYAKKAGVNVGAQVPCVGMCSTLNGIVNGDNVTTFQCVPTSVCKTLSAYNGCNSLPGDRGVSGCCCDTPNCNLASRPDIIEPPPMPASEYPISCWSGIYVDGTAISNAGYTTCFGDCASVTLNTTFNNEQHSASLYMCDPTSICRSLNMTNQCATVEPGLGGCCCNTDACLNPLTNTYPGNDLICYVGIYHAPSYYVGSEMVCNGKCASLQTSFGNQSLKSYHCAPTSVCKALAIDNSCGPVYKDSDVTACCCDSNNCNVQGDPIQTNTTAPAFSGTPIACQSGIYVDGVAITADNTFIACKGQCAKLSYPTNVTGASHVLDIYTCDPVSVCSALGMANSCVSSINGTAVSGCCCGYNGCVTPSATPTPQPGGSASITSFVAIIAAVYTLLRQYYC